MPPSSDQSRLATPPSPAPPSPRRPIWPVTTGLVLLGWCLTAWTLFATLINTAPFFGQAPSRDRYVESGMVALTAVAPLLLLLVLGLVLGSRWGLLLLAFPTVLLVPVGLSFLAKEGDPQDAGVGRAVRFGDAFADLTMLNWAATALLLVVLGTTVAVRRRSSAMRVAPGRDPSAT